MNAALVRHVLFPLHERLKRKPTFVRLAQIERTQWLARDRLAEYQLGRLRELLVFGYEHVPYCRSLFDAHGLPGGRIESFRDLERLPFLTREDLRTRFEDLRAQVRRPGVHRRSSGGSSGVPVTVLVDMGRMGMGEAGRLRAQGWFGVPPGSKEVVLWGTPSGQVTRAERIRRIRDWCLNTRVLSAFDMDERSLRRHAAAIRRAGPVKMYGYASALSQLAAYFERQRLRPPEGLRAVFTTAEPLFEFQRQTIQRAFGCRVAVEYGCRDGGLVALECPEGGLHVFAEGMYVEILDPDNEGRGEIVVTNLDSHAFPIIRYRTGDIGRFDPTPCRCGRGLPKLEAVEGRRTDFLVTPSGRVLHALAGIYILRELSTIQEFQIVQTAVDHLAVAIVPGRPLTSSEDALLHEQFADVFGADLQVDFTYVSAIPRTAAGKFRYVESKIPPRLLEELMLGRPQGAAKP